MTDITNYGSILQAIKHTIKNWQQLSYRKANSQLIETYFAIGKIISDQQKAEWRGTRVIDQLSEDLTAEFGDSTGYGVRNLKYMLKFYESYKDDPIVQQVVAQLPRGQNIVILDKCETAEKRAFYMNLVISKGLSRNVLVHQIEWDAYNIAQETSANNFPLTIPDDSDLAQNIVKDEYILHFLGLQEPFAERQLEKSLLDNIKQFLLELGNDFCFIGNQYKLSLDGIDYFVDILFYHRELKRLFAIELKVEEFKPEFVWKMNFYLWLLDDQVRKSEEWNSIGIILCKKKNKLTVEYALRDSNKPIAVATYQIVALLEKKLQNLES
jgi:predicted nuclease of restriction endonuclease-like (RecB) superfamily